MADPAPAAPQAQHSDPDTLPVIRKTLASVFERVPKGGAVIRDPVSEAQLLGYWLGVAVFVLITAVVIGVVIYLALAMPKITDFGSPATEESINL